MRTCTEDEIYSITDFIYICYSHNKNKDINPREQNHNVNGNKLVVDSSRNTNTNGFLL